MNVKDVTKILMLPFTIVGAVLGAFKQSEELKKLFAALAVLIFIIWACFAMISSSVNSTIQ